MPAKVKRSSLAVRTDHSPSSGTSAQAVDAVAAVRHVGRQPALEIAVAEPRDLAQERHAQPRFEMPPEAQSAAEDRQVEQHEESDGGDQQADGADPLAAEVEEPPEIEERAEEERLDDDAQPGHEERERDDTRRQETALAEHPQQLASRPRRRLRQGRGQLGGEGILRSAGHLRPRSADAHQHGAAEEHSLLRIAWRRGRRPHRPPRRRDGRLLARRIFAAPGEEGAEDPAGLPSGGDRARGDERPGHARSGVERREPPPCRIGQRFAEQPVDLAAGQPETGEAGAQRVLELLRAGPFAPAGRRHRHTMEVDLVEELPHARPAPAGRRVHHL